MNFDGISTEVEYVAVRSRGPGGQNVNKVSSASLLFWSFATSTYLTDQEKNLLRGKLRNCINSEEQIYLRSDEFRDLQQNKNRCLEKLEEMLIAALHKPKFRKASKPTRASKKRKMESKVKRSETKKGRQKFRH